MFYTFYFVFYIVVLNVFSVKFKLRKVVKNIFYIIRSLISDNIGRILISERNANYQKDRQISTGFGQCKNDDLSDNWVFFLISEIGPIYQNYYINDLFRSKFDGEDDDDNYKSESVLESNILIDNKCKNINSNLNTL